MWRGISHTMSTENGYLMLARRSFGHFLWTEKRSLSKFEAWLDLLQLAAFAPTKRIIRGNVIELGRGELVGSLRYLGDRWNWNKDKVASFLGLIESDQMIRREARHSETVVTICNYDKYNTHPDTETDTHIDTGQTVARHRPDNIEEGKEDEKGKSFFGRPEGSQQEGDWMPKGWRNWSEKRKSQTRVGWNTEKMNTIGAALGRRPTTLWTVAETEALLRIKPSDDEIQTILDYYLDEIPKDTDYRRHNLATLLNNWNGELDRARAHLATRRKP